MQVGLAEKEDVVATQAGSLAEDAFRPAAVDPVEAMQIALLVLQVAVVSDAERHHHVGRFVPLHASGRLDHVQRQGGGDADDGDEQGGQQTGID